MSAAANKELVIAFYQQAFNDGAGHHSGNPAGKHLNARVAHHFTVRGGLIVRFEQFVDTALVRDAATPDS